MWADEWSERRSPTSLNGSLTPAHVTHGERREVWRLCEGSHEYRARLDKATTGQRCNICTSRKFSTGDNDLATVEPLLVLEFRPERNPTDVSDTFASDHVFWWKCLINKQTTHKPSRIVANPRAALNARRRPSARLPPRCVVKKALH
ncbi:zinc-ribbon domain-containing protein [Leifsonia sp. Root112D2]|uniref:zinc-ribbon domain-containing protein n=1 Tax=Leifsonia sp. Root112D2 TaxID=1736426 RepID=UPI0009E9FDC6|nr:zinc-ribbon domain-containing protein [Leifsonia sp. Root112D2]